MQLPSFRRIIIEDFDPKERSLVSKLAYSINSFADNILNVLDGNLSIPDNLAASQKTFQVSVTSTGTPRQTINLITGLSSNCAGMQVISAVNTTNSIHYPTSAPFISFTNVGGNLIINNISGLYAGDTYTLTVQLWPVAS